jgi:hypothetical protein
VTSSGTRARSLKAAGAEIVSVVAARKYARPITSWRQRLASRYDGVRYGLRVPGRDIVDMYQKTRAEGFGRVRRRIDRHLCALGRLLRRVLSARAKVRTLIKRDFGDCFAKVCKRLSRQRRLRPPSASASMAATIRRNVSQRRVHIGGEHGGPSQVSVPGGLSAEACRSVAAHRAAVRRGDAVLAQAGDRGCRGAVSPERWW